jgi:hypothetical protein
MLFGAIATKPSGRGFIFDVFTRVVLHGSDSYRSQCETELSLEFVPYFAGKFQNTLRIQMKI